MSRTTTAAPGGLRVSPSVIIETTQLVRQSHDAIKCVNHLLANAEQGTTLESGELASLLIPIQERMYGALDELGALCSAALREGADHADH